MRAEFLPFCRPCICEADIEAVGRVLRSGWITTGPKSAEFEKKFCKYVGCEGAVALSCATGGMHLALTAIGIFKGDEVITPSMTWVSTINMIELAGATPVFADVDRDTMMVTRDTIEQCVTPRTRLIIPVHFAGAAVDMDPIVELAWSKDIPVMEDSAHGLGTFYKNDHVGAEGSSIFSFHAIKNITTAEGGMFCSDDMELLEKVRRLKFHGLGVDSFDRDMQGRAPQAEVIEPGYKYNMTDISAVLGINQLAIVDDLNSKRRELAMRYLELLDEVDEICPLGEPGYPVRHSWHLFIVRLDIDKTKMCRDEFMIELRKLNIGTGLHFRPVHTQKYYREKMGITSGKLAETEWNSERICSLPLFPDMTFDDVEDVVNAIKEILWKR